MDTCILYSSSLALVISITTPVFLKADLVKIFFCPI